MHHQFPDEPAAPGSRPAGLVCLIAYHFPPLNAIASDPTFKVACCLLSDGYDDKVFTIAELHAAELATGAPLQTRHRSPGKPPPSPFTRPMDTRPAGQEMIQPLRAGPPPTGPLPSSIVSTGPELPGRRKSSTPTPVRQAVTFALVVLAGLIRGVARLIRPRAVFLVAAAALRRIVPFSETCLRLSVFRSAQYPDIWRSVRSA